MPIGLSKPTATVVPLVTTVLPVGMSDIMGGVLIPIATALALIRGLFELAPFRLLAAMATACVVEALVIGAQASLLVGLPSVAPSVATALAVTMAVALPLASAVSVLLGPVRISALPVVLLAVNATCIRFALVLMLVMSTVPVPVASNISGTALLAARVLGMAPIGVLPIVPIATAKARGVSAPRPGGAPELSLSRASATAVSLPVPVVGAQSSVLPGVIVGVASNSVVPEPLATPKASARLVLLGGFVSTVAV